MGGIIPRKSWIGLTNYTVWRLLKVLESNKQANVRKILQEAGGSPNTNLQYLYTLAQWGLVKYQRQKRNKVIFQLTPLGVQLLRYYDNIGEIAKQIRHQIG